jgi:hypothetical protein
MTYGPDSRSSYSEVWSRTPDWIRVGLFVGVVLLIVLLVRR